MKLSVIANAGLSQATQILGGVYGHIENQHVPEGQPYDAASTKFKVAPEFTPVSSVFESIEQGAVPVLLSDIKTYEVPDDLATTVKANMMHALGGKWDQMYASMEANANANSMIRSMLAAERRKAINGARAYVQSLGMHPYQLSFETKSESYCRSTDIGSMNELLSSMKPIEGSHPTFTGFEVLSDDLIGVSQVTVHLESSNEGEELGIDEPRAWAFEGKKVAGKVTSTITVMATNENAAKSVACMMLGVSESALEAATETAGVVDQETGEIVNSTETGIIRSVNSFRETPMFGLLTTQPFAVDTLRAGSEIVYEQYEEDEVNNGYRERE